jgi:hypothetical protein
VVRAQLPAQVGQHVPEFVLGPGMVSAGHHLPGDPEPDDERDLVIPA